MSIKYHVSAKGEIVECKAKTRPCPLGGKHYKSKEEFHADMDGKYRVIDEYNMNKSLMSEYSYEQLERRREFVEKETNFAMDSRMSSYDKSYNVITGKWNPERAKIHDDMIAELMKKYAKVPSEGKVIFSSGLPGSGKTTVLTKYEMLNHKEWATVSSDDFKEMLAERNMIPEIEGLSPMESSTLVHRESSYLADRLLSNLGSLNKNIIYDFTCKNEYSARGRIKSLLDRDYKTKNMKFVFVDISIENAKERARYRYKSGLNEEMLSEDKKLIGGRFLPEYVIESSKALNSSHSSHNAETLISLHNDRELSLPRPTVYDNSGSFPVKVEYENFVSGNKHIL